MVGFAWARVNAGESMSGLVALIENAAFSRVIEDLLLIAVCAEEAEICNQVLYVPF